MNKVIKTLGIEGSMTFDAVSSFETDDYIGIWNDYTVCFVLIEKPSNVFSTIHLPVCYTLEDLDNAVYAEVEQHIGYVSESNAYKLTLVEN